MPNSENHKHIAKRISHENIGSDGAWHNPDSGSLVLQQLLLQARSVDPSDSSAVEFDTIISSTDQLHRLSELKPNPHIAALAEDWSINGVDFSDRPVVTYGTSGSETNGKELLQLLVAGQIAQEHITNPGAAYFIDTASHPVGCLFNTEAEMLALATGRDIGETQQKYRALFEGKVNTQYIDNFIQEIVNVAGSTELCTQIKSNWEERCHQLEVPADAIGLPELQEYLNFYKEIGAHNDISHFVEKAYQHIGEKGLNPTIGTLRCLMFSQIAEALSEKMGVKIPFVTFPMDKLSAEMGVSDIKLAHFKKFVSEVMNVGRDNRAYFSITDPFNMGERFLRLSEKKDANPLAQEFDRIVEQLPYGVVTRMGHNAGISYYAQMLLLGNTGFVLDNYEAGDPHYKIHAATNWNRGIQFISEPRGWVRIDGYERDANRTYGDSPLAESIYHGLMSDPQGIEKLRQYLSLIAANVGQNATIAMDVGNQDNSTSVYFVTDNVALTKNRKPESIGSMKTPFATALSLSKDVQNGIGIPEHIKALIEQSTKLKSELAIVENELEAMTDRFMEANKGQLYQYYLNKIVATEDIARQWSLTHVDLEQSPITDPSRLLGVTLPEDVVSYIKKQESSIYNLYELRLRQRLKDGEESKAPDERSEFYPFYSHAKETNTMVGEYKIFEAQVKKIMSVINVRSGNNKDLFEMVLKSIQSDDNSEILALPATQRNIAMNIWNSVSQLIDIYSPTDVHSFLTGSFEPELAALQEKIQSHVIELNQRTRMVFKDSNKIDKNETTSLEQKTSQITKLIEVALDSDFATEVLGAFDQTQKTLDMHQSVMTSCASMKMKITSALQEASLRVPKQEGMNDVQYVTVCLKHLTAEKNPQVEAFKAEVQKRWQELNEESGLGQVIADYRVFLDKKEPSVMRRNAILEEINKIKLIHLDLLEKDKAQQIKEWEQNVLEIE